MSIQRLKTKILRQVIQAILLTELLLLGVSIFWKRNELVRAYEAAGERGAPPALEHELYAYALRIGGMTALVILGTASIIWYRMDRLVLRPIRQIILQNHALAAGNDLIAPIPETDIPDDEIGDILRTRNKMIRKFHADLDQCIEQRTFALQSACDGLQKNHLRGHSMERAALLSAVSTWFLKEYTESPQGAAEISRCAWEGSSRIPVHPRDIVLPIWERLHPVFTSRNFTLESFIPDPLPHVCTDEFALRQALELLWLEAANHTSPMCASYPTPFSLALEATDSNLFIDLLYLGTPPTQIRQEALHGQLHDPCSAPELLDLLIAGEILRHLGAQVEFSSTLPNANLMRVSIPLFIS